MTSWVYDDGGRAAAGYKGAADDCVTRAIAIASNTPYQVVYELINDAAQGERSSRKRQGKKSSARTGVYKGTTSKLLESWGWQWTATMRIGQGCTVHLKASELPEGRIIVSCSRHLVAVIDGVIHDTHDPSRDGTRCVYGYWSK